MHVQTKVVARQLPLTKAKHGIPRPEGLRALSLALARGINPILSWEICFVARTGETEQRPTQLNEITELDLRAHPAMWIELFLKICRNL